MLVKEQSRSDVRIESIHYLRGLSMYGLNCVHASVVNRRVKGKGMV